MDELNPFRSLVSDLQNSSASLSALNDTLLSLRKLYSTLPSSSTDLGDLSRATRCPQTDLNVLSRQLFSLLHHKKQKIRHASCSLVEIMTKNSPVEVQSLMDSAVFTALLPFLQTEDLVMQKIALSAFHNTLIYGTSTQRGYIIQEVQLLATVVTLLSHSDNKVIMSALDCVRIILQYFESIGPDELLSACKEFSDLSGVRLLENLQQHSLMEVYQASLDLHMRFFPT